MEKTSEQISPVGRMFDGRSIFITGASGFIGRVLLEKLLRSYIGIKKIYILLRSKKNQKPHERLYNHILNIPIFDKIKSRPDSEILFNKIEVLPGDIGEPWLGLSDENLHKLFNDDTLSFVFHSAATIKFDEPLKLSVQLNLIATKTVIQICKRLRNLISVCHVSTAYVNGDINDQSEIEEKLYPIRENFDQLIQLAEIMDTQLMQELKLQLVDKRPNTYTYTKALAEHLIAKEVDDLPIIIVRPSIVTASWREPLPGWIDNLNGPTGLILSIGKGLLRTLHVSREAKADIVPVDITVNTMIAASFYVARTYKTIPLSDEEIEKLPQIKPRKITNITNNDKTNDTNKGDDTVVDTITNNNHNKNNKVNHYTNLKQPNITQNQILKGFKNTNQDDKYNFNEYDFVAETLPKPHIIHCNSGDLNGITWGEIEDSVFPIIRNYPSCQVLRYPFGTFKSNKYHDLITRLFAHYLPALILDAICGLFGKSIRLFNIYQKLHFAISALAHFCNQNYNFKTRNIRHLEAALAEKDRKELYMDIKRMNWNKYWHEYVLGCRRYLLKEDDSSLEKARRSFKRAYYIEIFLRTLIASFVTWLCWPILSSSTEIIARLLMGSS